MRALLYADWCTTRKLLPQYLLLGMVVSACVAIGAMQGVGSEAPGAAAVPAEMADVTITACAGCLFFMLSYFVLFAAFGADELNGWEGGRLASLPVSRGQAVAARYAFVGLVFAGMLVLAVPASVAVLWVASLLRGAPALVLPTPMTAAGLAGVTGVLLVIASVQMAVIFAVGLQRARAVTMLPFFLTMLLLVPPVRDAAGAVAGWAASLASEGSGALLGLVLLGAGAVCVAASLRVSQAVYARRDL